MLEHPLTYNGPLAGFQTSLAFLSLLACSDNPQPEDLHGEELADRLLQRVSA